MVTKQLQSPQSWSTCRAACTPILLCVPKVAPSACSRHAINAHFWPNFLTHQHVWHEHAYTKIHPLETSKPSLTSVIIFTFSSLGFILAVMAPPWQAKTKEEVRSFELSETSFFLLLITLKLTLMVSEVFELSRPCIHKECILRLQDWWTWTPEEKEGGWTLCPHEPVKDLGFPV